MLILHEYTLTHWRPDETDPWISDYFKVFYVVELRRPLILYSNTIPIIYVKLILFEYGNICESNKTGRIKMENLFCLLLIFN